ncbi:MAG: sugar ABC transporter ATP-binding protein [Planctomycetaceae bacterium]|nr:sugar ABC transporter ATP-binding protein [Planctomycetaceae bacterium]
MTDSHHIIRIDRVSKSFSGVPVLKDIDVTIRRGEILGIIGENGAGKSTLMKIISGIYQPTSGDVYVEGKKVVIPDAIAARSLGISLVPQEFNLVRDLPVYNNIFLGAELLKPNRLLDKTAMKARTRELLAELKVDIPPDAMIENLSAAEKQMVEIAKALAFKANVLIMDEPTTMLTLHEIDILFRLTRKLRDNGMTIIYISHKLKEVKDLCDRVLVLRDGAVVLDSPTGDISTVEMAQAMVGRELGTLFPAKTSPSDEVVFEVRGLTVPGVIEDISFALRRGEILGLAGLVGAGRTEVAETILGLRKKSAGQIFRDGREVAIREPRDANEAGISYLSEDRQGAGIITSFSVTNNTTLASLRSYSGRFLGRIDKKREAESVRRYIESFHIKTDNADKRLENLSGGNQQKVSLAKAVDTRPQVLIVDEPTRGVDVSAKLEIYSFLNRLARDGIACLVISSELEEVIGLCNRIIVMREGGIAGAVEGEAMNEEEIMFLATGVREEDVSNAS